MTIKFPISFLYMLYVHVYVPSLILNNHMTVMMVYKGNALSKCSVYIVAAHEYCNIFIFE